jgi:hypothetical protein
MWEIPKLLHSQSWYCASIAPKIMLTLHGSSTLRERQPCEAMTGWDEVATETIEAETIGRIHARCKLLISALPAISITGRGINNFMTRSISLISFESS